MHRNFIFLEILLILGVVAISGCISNESKTDTIVIDNSAYVPSIVNVSVGTTITWVNQNRKPQDVISDALVFDSGTLVNGQSFNYTFNQTGIYHYYSSINPNMKGTIVVFPSNASMGPGRKYHN